ncbi:MAG: bifunctional glutamate N-acetyltransferase/amino-acid acetyltransferase ArgJ [Deltaproteobacteria bacterium]|nr:bifunctional glutamate N-acetyltransferase/amino-acid acetyltransferase ArgJ [Deltaproteobacteria bacterium]
MSAHRPYVPPSFPPAELTLTSLEGVRAAGVRAGIKASGNPDVGLLAFDEPVAIAGVFTQNKLAAAPVTLCRAHLEKTGGRARAIVVNSGNANACTGERGDADARAMCERVATALGCPVEEVLVCSTGVIGVLLPMDKVLAGIDRAIADLSSDLEAGRAFLAAIQTTDAFPKEACGRDAGGAFAGVCKGAGMIHPDMATMLAFVGTDLAVSVDELRAAMPKIAASSFNAVHVDTHPSTNDTFLLFATGKKAAEGDFRPAATRVSRRLAWLIARDGEGATKVTTIEVRGASSEAAARAVADRVASSALVRAALFGNDPNWGRLVSQVGNAKEVGSVAGLRCTIQGITVFEDGQPAPFDRGAVSHAMAAEDVHVLLELKEGGGRATLMTSDLTYRYVEVNAEYTT